MFGIHSDTFRHAELSKAFIIRHIAKWYGPRFCENLSEHTHICVGVTNSMEQSPSWEGNSLSANEEFPTFYEGESFITVFKRDDKYEAPCNRPFFFFTATSYLSHALRPKLEDHPLSAVSDCLFSIFANVLHVWRPYGAERELHNRNISKIFSWIHREEMKNSEFQCLKSSTGIEWRKWQTVRCNF
jgi:hypothetical protein